MNKIEQLIEKYKPFITSFEKIGNNLASGIVEEFIKDLQSLQEPTEERKVDIKINKHSNIVNINCTLCKHCSFGNETVLKSYKYCPGCGAKIKRIA